MPDPDWKILFQAEIKQGESARKIGNEGMARVCARRAAGIVIGEYLLRSGVSTSGTNAFIRIRILLNHSQTKARVREITANFLLQVDQDHKLPEDIDLIKDARWLAKELLG